MEKDRISKIDGYLLKGLLTKKFKEDDAESSMTSDGFTDIEKFKRDKEHDLSSASFIHAEEDKPIKKTWKKRKKKLDHVTPWNDEELK